MFKRCCVCMFLVVICIGFTDVQAAMYDLTTEDAYAIINGAYFLQIDPRATGTGLINPFVRIKQANMEIVQGYNSSLRLSDPYPVPQFQEETVANWNHSLLLADVPTVSLDENGVQGLYKQFMLDINESGGDQSGLSLNRLRIFQTDTPDPHDYDPEDSIHGTLGWGIHSDPVAEIYNLGENYIELDYALNAGSGSGDMYAYIPLELFNTDEWVILYSQFGNPTPNSAGFEEWAIDLGAPVIPVPPSVIIGILGLGVAGLKLRKYA